MDNGMNLIIKNQNGVLVTDSREVAQMIGKEHKHLLRDIRGYVEILTKSNFGLSDFFIEDNYKDSTGRKLPCYLITKKGCDMVANKMIGEKGVLFTATYVTKFEEMEKQLIPNAVQNYLNMSEEDRAIAYFQKSKENKQLQLKLEAAKTILEENKDDIEMAKKLTETNNVYDIGVFSKILSISNLGRNNFYKFLRDKEILMKNNTPYQTHAKYFKVIAIDNAFQSSKTLIRLNGVKYIIKKLIEDGYLDESFNITKLIDELESKAKNN